MLKGKHRTSQNATLESYHLTTAKTPSSRHLLSVPQEKYYSLVQTICTGKTSAAAANDIEAAKPQNPETTIAALHMSCKDQNQEN